MHRGGGLKYVSLDEPSGYGIAARRYLSALARRGFPVTWAPMVPGRGWGLGYEPARSTMGGDAALRRLCHREIDYDTVLVHAVPEYFPLWRAREPGKRIIGYTTWETDRPPDHWPALLDGVDLLLVPCAWNRDVFRAHGVTTPIAVVPHIVHPGPYPESPPGDERVFYTIGPWTARKAVGNVLEAYARAFRRSDRVRLVVKTSREDFTRGRYLRGLLGARAAVRRFLRAHRDCAAIELVAETVPDGAIDALHAAADCYVGLGHGEGWSIPAFDAAAFGNAVVTTGFGGPLEYLSPSTADLVDYTLVPVVDRRGRASYGPTQRWAEPDLDVAAAFLRAIYERPEQARARARALALEVRRRFSESAVLAPMLEAIA